MRGYELLKFISDDEELYQLVLEALILRQQKASRGGRKGKPERKATREFEHFWKSLEGAKFRFRLERKLGGETAIRVMRGREARIKTTMILLIAEIQGRLES